MTTAEVQSLLDENTCLSCYGLGLSDLIKIGLLSDISSSGGGGGGTPSLPLNSVQFNDGGVFGGDADFTWNKTTNLLAITGGIALTAEANKNPFAITGYSLTGANAQSLLSLSGTWNTTGVPTAYSFQVTNTASGVGSLLFNFILGASSFFKCDTAGYVTAAGNMEANGLFIGLNGANFSANTTDIKLQGDVILLREASSVFSQRNSTFAQTYRLYRTFTDASNYERLALQTAAGQVIVAAETAGTGTDDIDLTLTPAGAGLVRYGTHSAVGVELVTGFITIKDAGGTSRKIAVIS